MRLTICRSPGAISDTCATSPSCACHFYSADRPGTLLAPASSHPRTSPRKHQELRFLRWTDSTFPCGSRFRTQSRSHFCDRWRLPAGWLTTVFVDRQIGPGRYRHSLEASPSIAEMAVNTFCPRHHHLKSVASTAVGPGHAILRQSARSATHQDDSTVTRPPPDSPTFAIASSSRSRRLPRPFPPLSFPNEWIEYPATSPRRVRSSSDYGTRPLRSPTACRSTGRRSNRRRTIELIAVAATGYDGIDLDACAERDITICNIRTRAISVPEHVFALALALRNGAPAYREAVEQGGNAPMPTPSCWSRCHLPLSGTMLGLIGHGVLGKRVETIARVRHGGDGCGTSRSHPTRWQDGVQRGRAEGRRAGVALSAYGGNARVDRRRGTRRRRRSRS